MTDKFIERGTKIKTKKFNNKHKLFPILFMFAFALALLRSKKVDAITNSR